YLFAARVIPYRGSWLDFEFDAKDIAYVRIDRRRKLPATTLLYALPSAATEAYLQEIQKKGGTPDRRYINGMSKEEILLTFYDAVTYTATKSGWKTPFVPERMRGLKLTRELVNAATGKAVLEVGEKITPRIAKKLVEGGLKDILVPAEDLLGRY